MEALVKLLECLDPDQEVAGDKYEDERRKLIRFFERKGVSSPDELADATFDRVAQKLSEGIQIENIGAYCYAIAQLILKEYWRKVPNTTSLTEDNKPFTVSTPDPAEAEEKESRSKCLDFCLHQLPLDTRELIIEYYSADREQRTHIRQAMADRLGINREALSNRMQRLRYKLGMCIDRCQARKV